MHDVEHDKPWTWEVKRLASLGGPVALTQLGTMLLGVVDMAMLGRVGVRELDAASLGNVWIFGTLIFGLGLIFGLDPILTQAHGAGDRRRVGLALQRGVIIALLASVPLAVMWLWTGSALALADQEAGLCALAGTYVRLQIPSIPFFLVFNVLRQYLQAQGRVAPGLWVVVGGNVFNVVANWALIFGHLGFAPMGLEGAAIASASTRVLLLLGLWAWTVGFGLHRSSWVPWSRAAWSARGLAEVLRHGVPVSLQYGLEMWAFQIATLMAGTLGERPLAAHSIVLNLASLSFMVPLGVSIGAAVRIGNLLGAGFPRVARRAATIALALGGAVMVVSAVGFVLFRTALPSLYTTDAAVIAAAAAVLPIAAIFQVFDGVQVVGGGVLRGDGNTVPAAVFNFVGYYLLAIPFAYLLAFQLGLGLAGIWWGLALGLAIVATCLSVFIALRGPGRGRPHAGHDG